MNRQLMDELRRITAEEQQILDGRSGVDKALYTHTRDFTIDSRQMLRDGKLIDIRPHTRFVHFPEHRHNYVEIVFMCQGHLTHVIDRVNRVELEEGDLLFLNQFSSHEILPAGMEDIAVNFMVLPEFFDTAQEMLDKGNVISQFLLSAMRREGGEGQYLHFKAAPLLPVQNLAENMIWSLLKRQPDRRRTNQFTMGLLFLELVNHGETLEAGGPSGGRDQAVMEALAYIQSNYRTASLTALANQMNLPDYALSKLIKTETGSTFKELLQQKRLHQAARLIRETDLPVSDVITLVGYDNTSYFYRVFREEFGLTPREYRQSQPGKENFS
ncbi:MAG TPA: helix-turn-helix domain-containing protein [Candidatus Merdivicinus excrementipullorum]|uniref:Helix-turn-helix domain-containing protein n=1 Tax=Candidatus Merdivicinus excrementipullorum TaxID=2840867 RepID=A0A9D1FPH3_9FIRM|nr:helix-turn-helix domain-containing protein [Candidatus Merdivicinus excrementipullorum]